MAGAPGDGKLAFMTDGLELPTGEREAALLRLKKRRDLQSHVLAYVVINSAVWGVWAVTGDGYPWPAWITGLWAIGLVFNVWDVYFRTPITEDDVQREIERVHPQQ